MNFSKEEHDILVKAYKESHFDLTMFKKGMLDRPVNSPMPWSEMTPEDAYNTVEALKDLLFQWESEACRSFEGLPNWTNSGTPAYNLLMNAFDYAKPYLEDAMVDMSEAMDGHDHNSFGSLTTVYHLNLRNVRPWRDNIIDDVSNALEALVDWLPRYELMTVKEVK